MITMLKSKLHRAVVTEADVNYVGSITIDKELMELLRGKDPAYYYTDILVPNGRTLSDFINRR